MTMPRSVFCAVAFISAGVEAFVANLPTFARGSNSKSNILQTQSSKKLDQDRSWFLDGISEDEVDLTGVRMPSERNAIYSFSYDNAVKVEGYLMVGPEEVEPEFNGPPVCYRKLVELSESEVSKGLGSAAIIGTGMGQEYYEDPGDKTDAEVRLSPDEAANSLLSSVKSATDATQLVFNVLGGDDLKTCQVGDALIKIVSTIDFNKKALVKFNSISFCPACPNEFCSITLVSRKDAVDDESDHPRGIVNGEVYFCNGKYFTTSEEDTVTFEEYL